MNCGINIEMRIKEAIQESGISLRELERKTGIERHYLKTIQELPARSCSYCGCVGKRYQRFVRN